MAWRARLSSIVFAGGGARNRCLVGLVREGLGGEVFVPEDPQMVGALGAALAGHEVHPVA
jgi:activator of 2-hydroxyglutaryl-CoA dehydratase